MFGSWNGTWGAACSHTTGNLPVVWEHTVCVCGCVWVCVCVVCGHHLCPHNRWIACCVGTGGAPNPSRSIFKHSLLVCFSHQSLACERERERERERESIIVGKCSASSTSTRNNNSSTWWWAGDWELVVVFVPNYSLKLLQLCFHGWKNLCWDDETFCINWCIQQNWESTMDH